MARAHYEEFSMLHENAEEWSIPFQNPPLVERLFVPVEPGRHVSALRWGRTSPRLVLLHGGAQNAHTFDTVALALGLPLLAIDLPGHGHSDAAPGGPSDATGHARDVTAALGALGIAHVPLVGMSLGGLVALLVASNARGVASRLGLIDVTPGLTPEKSRHVTDFVNGPPGFSDFDEMVARTVEHNPTRSASSLRRGVLHNAVQLDDGTWVWRHQRHDLPEEPRRLDPSVLWDDVARLEVPLLLVRATGPGSVVDDDDEAQLLRLAASASVARVDGSGHSVQGDQPLALAEILRTFVEA